MPEIDTFNKFLVAAGGEGIVFLAPVPRELSEDDALLLAAYLVSMVADADKWEAVLSAVENG